LNTIIGSLEKRFSNLKETYLDFEWLHLTYFKFMTNLRESAMNTLVELLTDCSPNMDKKMLQEHLIDFARK